MVTKTRPSAKMVPIPQTQLTPPIGFGSSHKDGQGQGVNLWQSILNDVVQRDDMRESHLLVLGDRGAGKRSLLQSVNKHCVRASNKFIEVDKMGSQYSGIDYSFLYVKDMNEKDALTTVVTADDNLPRMNVWTLQDVEKADLLKMMLRPEYLEYSAAVIVLDFDQPWEMMNALNRWMGVLSEAVLGAMKTLPLITQDQIRDRVAMHIKNFERNKEGDTEKKVVEESKGGGGRKKAGDLRK